MKDFVKQYDTNSIVQRLYVHWDVSTICQFKCSYCYAMAEYGYQSAQEPGEWGKVDTWARQELVIKSIKRSTLPVFLGLLGGEPTIHPNYSELLRKCHEAVSVHDGGIVYVVSNGVRGPEFWKKHPAYDDKFMGVLWSFHPEFHLRYGKDFYKMVESIKICMDMGKRARINIMLSPNKQYWPIIHKFVDIVESLPGAELHPHWIYDKNPHNLKVYDREFWEEFNRFENYPPWLVFEKANGDVTKLNDYKIYGQEAFKFKGWNCWQNDFNISYTGDVHRSCTIGPKSNPNLRASLIRDPFYFKNIKSIDPVICPHSTCVCDGLLKCHKEKRV